MRRIVLGTWLLAVSCGSAPQFPTCDARQLRGDSLMADVFDNIASEIYWGGEDWLARDRRLFMLFSRDSVGFCSEQGGWCRLYAREPEGYLWYIGGLGFAQWFRGGELIPGAPVDLPLHACEVPASHRGPRYPRVILAPFVAQGADDTPRAVRAQGLTDNGGVVTIPLFDRYTSQFPILIEKASKQPSVIVMTRRSGDPPWHWIFRPWRWDGTKLTEEATAEKIRSHPLAIVSATSCRGIGCPKDEK
jgi:hypothetical protein